MWSLINVSSNLHTTDAKFEPYLNNTAMFASFLSEGTTPSSSDKLNTFRSGVLICSRIS